MSIVQLTLDLEEAAVSLPESQDGGYDAVEQPNFKDAKAISGRLFREFKGSSWIIKYQYGYLDGFKRDLFLQACRKGQRQPISCAFLTRKSPELQVSRFLVTSFQPGSFRWSADGRPIWADFSVELAEVDPHD